MSELEKLEALDKTILTVSDVAPVLECSPHYLRLQAREDPYILGFPVCVIGTRVRIPKAGFLRWLRGEYLGIDKENLKS